MAKPAALPERLFAALAVAGMPGVPQAFSVVPQHQIVPAATMAEIAQFIRVFDRVTTRAAWQAAALRDAPAIARLPRRETCFFSAWDFHLPPEGACQLIEFNDNGSGCLLAAIVNATYYAVAQLDATGGVVPPVGYAAFARHVGDLVAQEAHAGHGTAADGRFLILDDAAALRDGRFRREFELLCDIFRQRGWHTAIGSPAETHWDGTYLLHDGNRVAFVVNRSTDFFWEAADFAGLRQAFAAGAVYVAPNPFTYATRSDKRLLEWLSLADWDDALGIRPDERQMLRRHTPETHLVRAATVDMLAQSKRDFVFKPLHGFAGHGLLDSDTIGRARLRHLARHGPGYVAQRRIAKPVVQVGEQSLWTDLRVWAYRGEVYNISGRASCRPDRLDLAPPGGWLPSYIAVAAPPAG